LINESVNQELWEKHKKILIVIVSVFSLIYGIFSFATVFTSDFWNGGTRIAWTSVSTINAPLEIGGDKTERVIGLPLNLTEPKIKLTSSTANEAFIEVSGGGGFLAVSIEEKNEFLNGKQLNEDSFKVGDYQIVKAKKWLPWIGADYYLLSGDSSEKIAEFSVNTGRPKLLYNLIKGDLNEDLEKLEDDSIRKKDKLLKWASKIALINDAGKIYLLEGSLENTIPKQLIKLPAEMVIKTAQNDIKFTVEQDQSEKKLTVKFKPPWRESSPLPPPSILGCEKASDESTLLITVANDLRPCESVFRLPFGDKAESFRRQLSISSIDRKFIQNDSRPNKSESNAKNNSQVISLNEGINVQDCTVLKVAPLPVPQTKPCIGTSQAILNIGSYSFEISTINSSFSYFGALILFFSIWLFFVVSVIWSLRWRNKWTSSLWVSYGVLLVVWDILVLRLVLSLRYVLDPEGLDKLSFNSLTRSFIALLLIPSLILIFIKLQGEFANSPDEENQMKKSRNSMIIYLLALTLLTIVLNPSC
jgi:hypothetical protein